MFGGGAENDEERITHSLMIFRASFHKDEFYNNNSNVVQRLLLTDLMNF